MTTMELIAEKVKKLPNEKQKEVLDFVEFLNLKSAGNEEDEDIEWSQFSLAAATDETGAEDGPEYTLADLKERYD